MNTMKLLAASALAIAVAGQAAAQAPPAPEPAAPRPTTQAPAAPSADSTGGIKDIIVTAQRRSQSLLSVPLSIQATTGEQLDRIGIRDLTSLQLTTPGYLPQTDSGYTQIYIRGVGNSIYVGADPSVATFVDDVPRIYGSMADNLFDVDRVEVLKGAQGGLYGRNATGGVVNIITRQPRLDGPAGNVLVSYGTKNTFRAAAYVNVPLGDKIAFSISGERDSHDPYNRNDAPANPYSAANFPIGAVLPVSNGSTAIAVPGVGNVYAYTPQQTADFFNRAIVVPKLNDQNFWAINAKLLVKPIDDFKVTLAYDRYDKHDNNGEAIFNSTPAYTEAALIGLFSSLGVTTNLPAGFVVTPTGKFDVAFGPQVTVDTREQGGSATVVWNGPGFDLTSISAYRAQHTLFDSDTATGPVATVPLNVRASRHYFYQELRAVSTFSGPLHLLGGATYLSNHQASATNVYLLSREINIAQTSVHDTIRNWSVYGEVGYDITPELNLTASGRYIHETNEATFTLPVDSSASTAEKKFIPSATLSYKIDGGNVYARWARGFKSGGINIATAPIFFPKPTDGSVFAPETVDTFEIGWRQALFDRKVQLTSAIFYNDYKNLQVDGRARPGFPAITTASINAASARTYGGEVGADWRIIPPITIGVNAGYLNAKYKDFKLEDSIALEDFDRSGQQMTKAPKLQLSFTGNVDQPISSKLNFVGTVLVSHVSGLIWTYSAVPGVLPNVSQPGYWQTNLKLGVRTADDRYGISIMADNLFNELHYTYGNASPLGNGLGNATPRIIRGEITAKF